MGKFALSTKGAFKIIGENFTKMNILENLIHGNLAIHQELINKFLGEIIEGSKAVKDIKISITGGFINLLAGFRAGDNSTIYVKLVLSIGNFEFNRFNRFMELPVQGPVILSIHGINIKARLGVDLDPDPAKHAGAPEGLLNLLEYLNIKEDKITLDFNKMPRFNQVLQNKLGFLLKNLEVTKLDLVEEMIIIHPTIKFF